MPIIAAPLEAVAVVGTLTGIIGFSLLTLICPHLFAGFVLVGIPVYYMTQRVGPREDTPLIVCEYIYTYAGV